MSVSIPPCTCTIRRRDPECEIHGNPGQLTLDPDDDQQEPPYDPATAEIPF